MVKEGMLDHAVILARYKKKQQSYLTDANAAKRYPSILYLIFLQLQPLLFQKVELIALV